MHVVIVGCGRVGSALARSLTEGGHTVAVIDKRPEAFGRLPSDFSGQMINGIGFDRDRLKEAGIEQAASLAAVTNGDNSNILIARVARETFGIENVVARIYDPRRAAIYQRLGIATVATVAWTTERVMRRLVPSEAAMEWIDPSARVSLVERTIAGSWSGHPLSDLEQPGRVRVAAVGRLGVAQVPNPDLVAQDGDVVYLAVASDASGRCRRRAGGRSGKGSALMRVVIAGGGSVGRFIGQQLSEAKHEVLIIDNDPAVVRAAQRSGEPDGVPWLQADACEATRLSEAQVDKADVVAAVTGDDEDNLVISLLAKQEFGVPRVVARVNNPKNEWMFNQMWGVDVAVSTPHLITALVQEAVSVGSFVRLLSFEGGKARLAEVTLAEGSPAADKEIVELGLPRDATVVAIVRQERVVVPRGDTMIRAGDEVIVLVTSESEDEVTAILTGA